MTIFGPIPIAPLQIEDDVAASPNGQPDYSGDGDSRHVAGFHLQNPTILSIRQIMTKNWPAGVIMKQALLCCPLRLWLQVILF